MRRNKPHQKIIAVDFDGCLATCDFPKIGAAIQKTIDRLKSEQSGGAKVILWTCRQRGYLNAAVEWCARHGVYFDAVNKNLPEVSAEFGGDSRKIYADEYWDDCAVRMPPDRERG